jgi:hypothetical protein
VQLPQLAVHVNGRSAGWQAEHDVGFDFELVRDASSERKRSLALGFEDRELHTDP